MSRILIELLKHAVIYGWLTAFVALIVKLLPDQEIHNYLLYGFTAATPVAVALVHKLERLKKREFDRECFLALQSFQNRSREALVKVARHSFARDPQRHVAIEPFRAEVLAMLQELLALFKVRLGHRAKLWTSFRERRTDGLFWTDLRTGTYHRERANSSKALPRNAATVRMVFEACDQPGPCNGVIITGPRFAPNGWTRQINDHFGEDAEIMMAGVCLDRGVVANPRFSAEPVWLISICSDHEKVFTQLDLLLMRSCIEEFAKVANQIALFTPAHVRQQA